MIDDAGPGAAGGATAPVGRRLGSRSSFVGRQEELSTLVSMLRGPETGVITITGVPGIGKTRLAIEACAHLDKDSRRGGPGDTGRTPTGVPVRSVLVPLAEVSEASSIPLAIAAARQACNYSAERQPAGSIHAPVELLVLDNVEHLSGAAEQVLGLLCDTAGLRVLNWRRLVS